MLTFYEYLDWWVEERDEYPISLRLGDSFPLEAGKEVSIIASLYYGSRENLQQHILQSAPLCRRLSLDKSHWK